MPKRPIESKFDIEMDRELVELEQEIEFMLDEYDVEFPSEVEMMVTIEAMRPYVPKNENKWKNVYGRVETILQHSAREVFYITPLFWLLNGLFLVVCIGAVILTEADPYLVALLFAPLPTITGLLEVLKSKNNGMAELELSLKYNLEELILSKLVIIGGFNLVLNVVLTACISAIYPEIWIGKMALYWITPFTVISAVSLFVVTSTRQSYIFTGGIVVWISVGILVGQTDALEMIERLPSVIFIVVSVISMIYVVAKMNSIYKRGISYEFNH
ncbi:hypothetical protein [Fredinandcohnia sp. 179-A 10B2 NHS]|uniref:hypothetical protein n=1 Tax=Fredinandcohnia sp. 179-A 10B2 NHS TaxID=3235176 RepID=UPI0039A28D57